MTTTNRISGGVVLSRHYEIKLTRYHPLYAILTFVLVSQAFAQSAPPASNNVIVFHAARLLDIEAGKIITPSEVLVQDDRIVEVGSSVKHPQGAEVIDLGDTTLLPGLIDVHVHLFLHPGAEDLQTVEVFVPQRTIIALWVLVMT